MKRILLLILVLILSSSTLFASSVSIDSSLTDEEKAELKALLDEYFREDVKADSAFHLSADTAMIYGYPTVGGILDFGINIDTVTIAAYARYVHFFKPLGSATGRLAIGEEMGELGLKMNIRIYELGRFNVNVGINTAWYQQWLMLRTNAGTYNLTHNGLLIRPESSIGWRFIDKWTMELGLFYQTPLYPTYEGYQGWGCFVKVL